jgi:valyl-tRNA synthetase
MADKELAKVYEPSLYEDGIYKKWQDSGFFNPDNLELDKDAPSFTISMPPPNVTGNLHIGHAVMLAIEDLLVRYHRLRGQRALWLPGTDHAAIATQTRVEKDLKKAGVSRHDLGREKFLAKVEQFAADSRDYINNQVKKMGSSCDWSREAYTLDPVRTRAVRLIFKMMHDDGLIYRGERIINWCPRCQSTLADDEVEYRKQKSKLYTFRYDKNFPFPISTTRPETKLGDSGVAVNPNDERYKEFVGKEMKADFCGLELNLKVIADHHVEMQFGTGALGVTPAHSFYDWELAHEHHLPIIKVIDRRGHIRRGFGVYYSKKIKDARELIVAELIARDLLEKTEDIENNVSVCYRCETPVEPMPSRQWFINVGRKIPGLDKSMKELAIEAVKSGVFGREKIRIVPEKFEKNYFHWLNNLHDWCISRQIWFGHRIPVWYCCDSKHNNDRVKESANPECNDPIISIDNPGKCPRCGAGIFQDEGTLDTWFSSGLWTFSTLAKKADDLQIREGRLAIDSVDFKRFHPTSVLNTGYDILFFWVARMIIMTTYAVRDIPFQTIYLHGLVRDEKGRKMSKSLGNVYDPLDMIKKFGTDATRLSLLIGNTPGNDMNLGEEKVAGYRNFTNKLWNIARFILKSSAGAESGLPAAENLTLADRWILTRMEKLISQASAELDRYNFSAAGEHLKDFTWNDLADWYLEISKFEKAEEKSKILVNLLEDILRMWHPYMPFVTEAIWAEMGKPGLLMVDRWPKAGKYAVFADEVKAEDFEKVKNLIIAIRNARSENGIEPGKKIKAVVYAGENAALFQAQSALIISLRTGLEALEIKETGEKVKDAIYIAIDGAEIYLMHEADRAKEKEKIEKELETLEKAISAIKARLADQEFTAKAPAEIIKKEEERLEKNKLEAEKLKERYNK